MSVRAPQASYWTSTGASRSARCPNSLTNVATSHPKRSRSGSASRSTLGGSRRCRSERRKASSRRVLPRCGGSCRKPVSGSGVAMVG